MDGGNQYEQIVAVPFQRNPYLGNRPLFVEQPGDQGSSASAESKTDNPSDVDETDLRSAIPATYLYSFDPSVQKGVQEEEGHCLGDADVAGDCKTHSTCCTHQLLFAIAIGLAVLAAIATGLVSVGLATNWHFR